MTRIPAEHRYAATPYRRCGLQLPAVSLGLWNNVGDDRPIERQRGILRRPFDLINT
jgi:L-glyceraldehyde 3-phosphate reductase